MRREKDQWAPDQRVDRAPGHVDVLEWRRYPDDLVVLRVVVAKDPRGIAVEPSDVLPRTEMEALADVVLYLESPIRN